MRLPLRILRKKSIKPESDVGVGMNIIDTLHFIQSQLKSSVGEFALPQSEEILQSLLQCSRSTLYLRSKESVDPNIIKTIESIVKRRLKGEPLQYILGKVFFYSREFNVTPDVLIPRPDTEILVEQVLLHEKKQSCFFADIGTGSGIIACILTETQPEWKAIGIDISYKSLLIAKSNIQSPVHLLCGDLLKSIKEKSLFDFIVSNPPYISDTAINALDPGVKDFEPWHALSGGIDGLQFYRYLSSEAHHVLIPGGALYCEIGFDQEAAVKELFFTRGWKDLRIFKDLGGHARVIRAVAPE
jgi:release factor glutamine methyltransferase